MNTIPTIAAGFPSLRAAAWIGQGRAFVRRSPDVCATGAPRCYHPFGHRARQRTRGRFTGKLKALRSEFAVSVIVPLHGANHAEETDSCPSTRKPVEFFRVR